MNTGANWSSLYFKEAGDQAQVLSLFSDSRMGISCFFSQIVTGGADSTAEDNGYNVGWGMNGE